MRLVLVMPTGVRVGYDDYSPASPLGIETLAAHAQAHADVSLVDMRGKGQDIDDHAEPKVIYFADDNFCHDIRRVEAICQAIVERRTDAHFWCQGRVDVLAKHPEVLEWMGKAHFSAVLARLETPNPRQLKASRKEISVEQMARAIEPLHAHDIGVWGTFVLGLPGETREETEATASFVASAACSRSGRTSRACGERR